MEFFNLPSFIRNPEFVGKTNKQFIGSQSKRKGDAFEQYFTSVLKQLQAMKSSPIVAFRKHSNEIVKTLANIKRFDLIAKLGYLKGDLDFSITLKCGYTVFAECKSGDSPLSKEQKQLIEKYKEYRVPYFLYTEKDKKNQSYIKATHNLQTDIQNMYDYLLKAELYAGRYPFQ